MSWYNPDNPGVKREKTPPKNPSYVQVPSASPIYVKSPSGEQEASGVASAKANRAIDEAKEKAIESRRQAIRNHGDFPMVSKRFYYLPESDIFKGFVKGKGNLRDITRWLTENYDKDAILAKQQEAQRAKQQKEEAAFKQRERERLLRDYQAAEEQRIEAENRKVKDQPSKHKPTTYDLESSDDDADELSPVKRKSATRAKSLESPVKHQTQATQEKHTTKVELTKPKMSILDKYRFRQTQPSLKPLLGPGAGGEDGNKKRKLVRLSSLNSSSSRESSPQLDNTNNGNSVAFNFNKDFQSWKKFAPNKTTKSSSPPVDELDILEEKIKMNRANRKHADQYEEEYSDDMSQDEEYESNSGLTSMDTQILEFLNNAEQQDITEIALIPPRITRKLMEARPFSTIYEISEANFESEKEQTATKKKVIRKTMGQKIIENTETSLKGYRAVDSLVKKCSEVGSLISKQMEAWGVTATGEGELEMVELEPKTEVIEIEDEEAEDEDDDDVMIVHHKKKTLSYIHGKPSLVPDEIELKNYQQVGINWLNLIYSNHLSCILADEMGLGKTCEVISFMAYLHETKQSKGPHLVVVPSSTLENWLREFNKFCPSLTVQAYYGTQKEREDLRYDLQDIKYDVLITTYHLASGSTADFKYLKNQNFDIIVYDEGHMLKNSNSERYIKLMRLKAKFRLLLTGTPLQNNLKELVSLLAFMLPELFNEKREDLMGIFNQRAKTLHDDEDYNPLLSIQAISKAKTMMTPFVLRRKKNQVLKHLPEKIHKTVKCELRDTQKKIYEEHFDKAKSIRKERERRKLLQGKEAEEAKKTPIPSSTNTLMSLRKAAMHPLLFRYKYSTADLSKMAKAIMMEPEYADANQQYIFEDMELLSDYELDNLCNKFPKTLAKWGLPDEAFMDSGKVIQLRELLRQVMDRNEKALVFSLFTQMLDILEKVLSIWDIKFLRLDGATSVESRQDIIDKFYEDGTIPVFLLSTRAGGFGINLVAANNVIIFDQSFNPHDDKQAEDRAHRVGQTSKVIVSRLITENSVEENILQLAENKLQLDQSISNESNDTIIEEKAASAFERLLFGGTQITNS